MISEGSSDTKHCSNAENSALQHKDKLFENVLKMIFFFFFLIVMAH